MRLHKIKSKKEGSKGKKIDLFRPKNSLLAAVSAIFAYLFSNSFSPFETSLIFFSVFLITGAGNAINDYFDYKIDKKTKPRRPIPSGVVTREEAKKLSLLSFFIGISLSYFISALNFLIAYFTIMPLGCLFRARLDRYIQRYTMKCLVDLVHCKYILLVNPEVL